MSSCVQYPGTGCIVEFLEGNAVHLALVIEDGGGKVRLLLPNRRETRLTASRLLPWAGPQLPGPLPGREEAVRLLEDCRKRREELAAAVPVLDLWEMAQGEVAEAPARWFAELSGSDPDVDSIAAHGRALLACKSHFRFQPPVFQVFDAETVEKRLHEQREREDREALTVGGASFFRLLWDVACKKRSLPPPPDADGNGGSPEWPQPDVARRLEKLLFDCMADPDNQEHDTLWRMLTKGLPDVPHLPVQLLMAWGIVPPHYNFWFDRAGYEAGDNWWHRWADEVRTLIADSRDAPLPACDLPFISIDSASTRDVDDAFHLEAAPDGGFLLTLALAYPALCWPFGSPLDKAVLRRGTSIYLPEGDCHMLPEHLGTDSFSLRAGEERPAFCVRVAVDADGNAAPCELFTARVRLAANLTYHDAQAVLDARRDHAPLPDNPAAPFADALSLAHAFERARQAARIRNGAVVMDRPEPVIRLEGEGAQTIVRLEPGEACPDSQSAVAEMMILASAAVADWAAREGLPLLHRTQDVALPREYAGVWTRPEDMTRVMRALAPSTLEVQARPHAALGLPRYAPVTSPLRRYPDLVNEAQIVHRLTHGSARWNDETLADLLVTLNAALEAAGQVQRYRPRYWKLLFFRQQGDKIWWPGVITEENDMFATVSLPDQGLFLRGKRRQFDERACPGTAVEVRIGRVNPLYNEIMMLEARTADS